jgi:glycosyltransferase involved in cell wall biosynthesis
MANLFVWNGMGSQQNSGGDLYSTKFIKYSNYNYDIISSENSKEMIKKKRNRIFITDKFQVTKISYLIFLYLFRIIRSIFFIKKYGGKYSLAIASSPFLFDIFPLIFCKADKRIVILFHILPNRKSVTFSSWVRFKIAEIEKLVSYLIIKLFFQEIITGNVAVKTNLEKIFPKKKIIVGDAGIDIESFKIKKKKRNKNLACFIGRLTSQKGILDLVGIMKEIVKINPKFKLILIGKGPDEKELISRIRQNKLSSNIILKGFVSDKEKIDILGRSKFFFFPSYEEGWGIALAEALYTENLCICYELPYYKSVFGKYPIYVKTGNVSDFIDKFFKNYNLKVKKGQKKEMQKYNNLNVIKTVLKKLN